MTPSDLDTPLAAALEIRPGTAVLADHQQHQTGYVEQGSESAWEPSSWNPMPKSAPSHWSASQPKCMFAFQSTAAPVHDRPSAVVSGRAVSQAATSERLHTQVPAGQASAAEAQSTVMRERPNWTPPAAKLMQYSPLIGRG
ncbi:MAG TPA: hypothetical protein VNB06_15615 [Thermoanaerobaculia bacterium]|nr:hypothetical protein [Thermoanaerobaculia bacterium]